MSGYGHAAFHAFIASMLFITLGLEALMVGGAVTVYIVFMLIAGILSIFQAGVFAQIAVGRKS